MTTRYYYWLYGSYATHSDPYRAFQEGGIQEKSKDFLILGGNTEEEARSKGLDELGGTDFQIIKLPTRTTSTASQMLKARKLGKTHSIGKSLERLGHDRTIKRRRARQSRQAGWGL